MSSFQDVPMSTVLIVVIYIRSPWWVWSVHSDRFADHIDKRFQSVLISFGDRNFDRRFLSRSQFLFHTADLNAWVVAGDAVDGQVRFAGIGDVESSGSLPFLTDLLPSLRLPNSSSVPESCATGASALSDEESLLLKLSILALTSSSCDFSLSDGF